MKWLSIRPVGRSFRVQTLLPFSCQVMKLIYTGDNELVFDSYVNVLLEEHVTCECMCRVSGDECDYSIHYYDIDACMCRCISGSSSCAANKNWSENLCTCVCPNMTTCFEDEVYDFSSCRLVGTHNYVCGVFCLAFLSVVVDLCLWRHCIYIQASTSRVLWSLSNAFRHQHANRQWSRCMDRC